jgi:hypothetical protein
MAMKRKDRSHDRSLYKKRTEIERYFMEILEWSAKTGVELG